MVTVRIVAQSACGGCSARSACGMSESQEKLLEVRTHDAASYSSGDEVTVGVYKNMAMMAVLLGYVGALVVLVAMLLITVGWLGLSEGQGVAASLGAVTGYYIALWLMRNRIEGKIHFTITKR